MLVSSKRAISSVGRATLLHREGHRFESCIAHRILMPPIINNKSHRSILSDSSLWFLLISNIVTIFFAISEGWDLSTVVWIYWFQSITIGFFNFIRILQLKEFSADNLLINGKPAGTNLKTKNQIALFFLFHYGFFHFVYLVFLLTNRSSGAQPDYQLLPSDFKYIFLASLTFFVNHSFSYFHIRSNDTNKLNIGSLMMYPYVRIIPMHFIIMLTGLAGSIVGIALPIFLILKTFADGVMHIIEHRLLRKTS